MNDEKLYGLCKKYGENALYFRRKFIGLLPEVNKRKLYEKKKFESIFEFAAKLCGVSEEQVRRVLNLEKKFEDMPVLKEMLVNGEVSASKLARVASIATPQNEGVLAMQVIVLPQKALEVLVRDERMAGVEGGNINGLQTPLFDDKSVRAHGKEPRLDDDIKQQLFELQEMGIDINEMIRGMLKNREAGISTEKIAVGEEEIAKSPSRYISIRIRKILKQEYGDKCSMPNCNKPARQIHHTQRFALTGAHNPRYMAPMCENHHKIAHAIDQKVQVARRGG